MFRVTAGQLDAAGGKVRCSRCREVFNARGHLQESASRPSAPAEKTSARPAAPPEPTPSRHTDPAPAPRSEPEPDIDIELESAIRAASQLDLDLQGNQPTPRERPADARPAEVTSGVGDEPISYEEIDLGFDLKGGDDSLPESAIQEMQGDATEPLSDAAPPAPVDDELDIDFGSTPFETESDDIGLDSPDHTETPDTVQVDDATTSPLLGDTPETLDAAPSPDDEESSDDWLTVDLVSAPDESEDHTQTSYELAMDATDGDHDQPHNLFSDWGQSVEEITYTSPPGAGFTDEAAPPPDVDRQEPPSPAPATEEAPMDETEGDDEAVLSAIASVAAESEAPRHYGNALAEELEATLTQPKHRLPTLLFGTGSLLLVALLLVQSGSAFRDQLARYPLLAPLATLFCNTPECTGAQRRAPQQIRIINRDVRPHPSEPGALLISLTFVNEAPFAQPYPVLEIRFSDTQDRPVALRRFQPSEYLSGERRSTDPLKPGERVAVSLSVVDPGEQGVSYRFEFY